MGHPDLDNRTPFAFEPMFVGDENGRPLLVCVIKATYAIKDAGELAFAPEQVGVSVGGECRGDPARSSYKYEPETAWFKPFTDVVLVGTARAPHRDTTVLDVGFRVGPVQQVARVFGDRVWSSGRPTRPVPFERIPLIYERSYGGIDLSLRDTDVTTPCEPRNAIGRGYVHPRGRPLDGESLPNIEDPGQLIDDARARPAPVGFGFTSPNFQPRAAYGGTYDATWAEARSPHLPLDFDPRFFNAAPPALTVHERLRGDEPVRLLNVSPEPKREFRLPAQPSPVCRVDRRHGRSAMLETRLDTVIVNADDGLVMLLWRTALVLSSGAQDVRAIEVTACESASVPFPAAGRA